jgi:hypothetical protein
MLNKKVKKSEIQTDFLCNICNKFYASTNSIYNHNKKFHTILKNTVVQNVVKTFENIQIVVQNSENIQNVVQNFENVVPNFQDIGNVKPDVIPNIQNITPIESQNIIIKNSLACEFCNKIFASRFSKYKHKKKHVN